MKSLFLWVFFLIGLAIAVPPKKRAIGKDVHRITGNHPFPMTVQIWVEKVTKGNFNPCTGFFVAAHYILTACHCLDGKIKNGIIDVHGTNGSKYTPSWYECHPQFNPLIIIDNYDIAIIRTTKPYTGQLARLPRFTVTAYEYEGTFIGGGLVELNSALTGWTKTLVRNVVPSCPSGNTVNNVQCFYADHWYESSSCGGDSGSPIFKIDDVTKEYEIQALVIGGVDPSLREISRGTSPFYIYAIGLGDHLVWINNYIWRG